MEKLKILLDLRRLLLSMERELGLDDLSGPELDIFLAAQSLTSKCGEVVTSSNIRGHDLVKSFAPATYHRALKHLVELGLLRKAPGAKAKSYIVSEEVFGA